MSGQLLTEPVEVSHDKNFCLTFSLFEAAIKHFFIILKLYCTKY